MAVDEGFVGGIDEDGAAEGVVALEDALHAAPDGVEEAHAGFGGEGDGGGRGLVEEIGLVCEGGFLTFDVFEEQFDLLHAVWFGGAALLGLGEISTEGVFFDAQGVEAFAEGVAGRLADLGDLPGEGFQFRFGEGDLLGEEDGVV